MSAFKRDITELIGGTPLMELTSIEKNENTGARLFAKLEYFNPTGSAKDRAAWRMILDAEKSGRLTPGSAVIEPTSGNTGISLAAIAAARGYRAIIVMPDTMSIERRKLISAFGAEVVLTDGAKGVAGSVEKAHELAAEIPDSFIPDQFSNPSNANAHYDTTGPEIFDALDGKVDIYVATVGTGGTLTGTARYIKEKNPNAYIAAVEPAASPLLTKGVSGAHKIQGIGANFIPDLLDRGIYDEVIPVSDEASYACARMAARSEGLFVGISSGAALAAGLALSKRAENAGKNIVVLFPDTGARYLSTPDFID